MDFINLAQSRSTENLAEQLDIAKSLDLFISQTEAGTIDVVPPEGQGRVSAVRAM